MTEKIKNYTFILFLVLLYLAVQEAITINADKIMSFFTQNNHGYIYTPFIIVATIICTYILYRLIFLIKKESMYRLCFVKKTKISNINVGILLGVSLCLLSVSIFAFDNYINIYDFFNLLDSQKIRDSSFIVPALKNSILISLLTVIPMGIVAPVFEELLFRGIILNKLKKYNGLIIAILIQAIIFGFVHFNIKQTVIGTILGILLGMLVIWTKSIWTSVMTHVFYNLLTVIISQLSIISIKFKLLLQPVPYSTADIISSFVYNQKSGVAKEPEILKASYPIWYRIVLIVISLSFTILSIYFLWRNREVSIDKNTEQ